MILYKTILRMKQMLDKTQLLSIGQQTKTVKLDQGELLIKEFTTSDREKFEVLAMKMQKSGEAKNMKAKLISISVINDNGSRFFGDDEIEKIAQMPSTITETLFNEILAINGMANDALDVEVGN